MSNGTKSGLGNNVTAIVVALLGAVSAIGGAWITTYGTNSANRIEAASAPTVIVSSNAAQTLSAEQTSASPIASPSTSPAPQPTAQTVTDPAQTSAPSFLPNSQQIAYNQPWPNNRHANQLVLETVEVAENVVRVHLRFDNPSASPVRFYTSIGGQGIRSYINDKKEPQYPATGAGGDLFADPTAVEIPAGSQKRGWLEYTTDGAKLNTLNLNLESYTEGYPAGESGSITYDSIKLKLDK